MRPTDPVLKRVCALVAGFALLACLPSFLAPIGFSAEGDALDYRVPLLRWVLRHHAYPNWPWTFVDDYPMLGEILMLPFFAMKAELARVVSLAAYFACAFFGAQIGATLAREGDRQAAWWFTFANLLGLQVILVPAMHVMVDNVATAFALASLAAMLRGKHDRSALLLAGALATRYTVWGTLPGALAALWLRERSARRLLRYGAIAILGALPFAARNLALHGNPVFPLLDPALAAFDGWGRGKNLTALALFPLDLLYTNSFVRALFDTNADPSLFFTYKLGWLFYAQLAAALACLPRTPPARAPGPSSPLAAPACFALGQFAFWWLGSQQLRFLGLALVIANVALLAMIIRRAPRTLLTALALLPVLSVAAVQQEGWRVALGREPSLRDSAYVRGAEECFRRAGMQPSHVLGIRERNGLLGFFDQDFVFLPGSNLYFAPASTPAPRADFVYSVMDTRPLPGYAPWPAEKPCLLRRAPYKPVP